MPSVTCPYPTCQFTTEDVDIALAVELLKIHGMSHSSPQHQSQVAKVERVSRPTITTDISTEEWQYFVTRWNEYVQATGISGSTKLLQLLECCDEKLRRDLTKNTVGPVTGLTIEQVTMSMKKLAVREEVPMVARAQLHLLQQDHDEPVRAFCARVRGQATICNYTTLCPSCNSTVNYTDSIITDVVSQGLADKDIQLDLLGDSNQLPSLDEVLTFVEKKEAGKRSANRLAGAHQANAAKSTYRRQKEQTKHSQESIPINEQTDRADLCTYCGQEGHGSRAPTRIRQLQCPAFGHTCQKCNARNHFASVCRGRRRSPKYESKAHQGNATFDQLCTLTHTKETKFDIALDHHIFDHISDRWLKEQSMSQPKVTLNVALSKDDYHLLGSNPKAASNPIHQIRVVCIADTGCQSCLAGTNLISALGIHRSELTPVKMTMKGADNSSINILGAVITHLSDIGDSKRSTKQIVYISDSTCHFFLSRQACLALGIISSRFPTIGECLSTDIINNSPCMCPPRQKPPTRPTTVPFPPIPENRQRLEQWLLNYYASSTFNVCEHTTLPMMESTPLRLAVDRDCEPKVYHTPIPVPIHWQDEVKAGLDRDVSLGVIEPVPVGTPVTYCHRMVVCAKKNGKPRRTVDMQSLNAHAKRETHHTPSPFHLARAIPHNTKKSVCDAWNGYHSVPLHEDDRHLTTFITPWGRYRYRVCPQGYITSGDAYTRRFDDIIAHIRDKVKCVDDTLLWSKSIESSFHQVTTFLETCGNNGITLNPEKFVFASDSVEFAGFNITTNTVKPSNNYLQAIKDFPTPKSLTDVRSWFGLLNQVAYTFSMAKVMAPFRELLKPRKTFYWDDTLSKLFNTSKSKIIEEINHGVQIFDKSKPTCIVTDWSKSGIGFWLFQKHCTCTPASKPLQCCLDGWKVALVGSRFTHPAESRYSPIEGEALAVADALDRARHFVLGCTQLTIAVDHKPLLGILSSRALDDISNPRLRNLKEKTLRYRFQVIHIPGVKNKASDSLSRNPSGSKKPNKLQLEDDIGAITPTDPDSSNPLAMLRGHSELQHPQLDETLQQAASINLEDLQSITWDKVQVATTSDRALLKLSQMIETGKLAEAYQDWPPELSDYHQFRDHLYTIDGVIMYKNRIVIPPKLRERCLTALHAAHQGVSRMTARAEASIFWPGITSDIIHTRNRCDSCSRISPSQPNAPPFPRIEPAYPFQSICADYFSYKGTNYLVIVDRYSNWPIVERARDGSKGLISCLRQTFATYGIADELSSDGGPEFTATATKVFLQQFGVHHRLSSAGFPHSNCRAEVAVKTVKRLIMDKTGSNGTIDTNAFQLAILHYRNSPDPTTKLSPAQCIFGRPIKDLIPIKPGKYLPHPTWRSTLLAREEALRNRHMIDAERWTEHTKQLPPLKVGDKVRIQNQNGNHPTKWDKTGTIIEVRQFNQYAVRVDGSGRTTIRNRKFLRLYTPVQTPGPYRTIYDDLPITRLPPPKLPDPSLPSPSDATKLNAETTETQPEKNIPETSRSETSTDDDYQPSPAVADDTQRSRPTRERKRPAWLKDYVI